MFEHYKRRDTNLVACLCIGHQLFQKIKRKTNHAECAERFPAHLEENEFILLFEIDNQSRPTGNELTLFVSHIYGKHSETESYVFSVVHGNSDVFWTQQKLEV